MMADGQVRKIKAVFFIALLVGADAHGAHQDALFSGTAYESFQERTLSVAKQMELLQANSNFRELTSPFAEQMENVMANSNFEKLTRLIAEQMKTLMANPELLQQAKHFAQQTEAVNANLNSQEQAQSVAEQMVSFLNSTQLHQSITEQMESLMANPTFQEQAKQVAESMKALEADPSFEAMSKRVDEYVETIKTNPNYQEHAKRIAEEIAAMNADPNHQEKMVNFAEQVKTVAKQMEALNADPNFHESAQHAAEQVQAMLADANFEVQAKSIVKQMETLQANPNFQEHAKRFAEHVEMLKAEPALQDHAMRSAEQVEAVPAANLDSQEQTEAEQAGSYADSVVDNLVDKLSGRVGTLSSRQTGLDESTVGKSAHHASLGGTLPALGRRLASKKPAAIVQAATDAGASKAKLDVSKMLVRGMMSGLILGIATSLAMGVMVQPLGLKLPVLGALVFPAGFVMLVLLGFELVTGNMALLPMAAYAGKASPPDILKSIGVVTSGNFLGGILYAVLFWAVASSFGLSLNDAVGKKGATMAMMKTTLYATNGARGWFQCLVKAILCNWMVTMGSVLSFSTDSTMGRIAVMWLPILTFFAQQFEHLVVNFFVIPLGMLFGADVSIRQWILWNMIPVFIGNFIGGAAFTGLPLAYTYPVSKEKEPKKPCFGLGCAPWTQQEVHP